MFIIKAHYVATTLLIIVLISHNALAVDPTTAAEYIQRYQQLTPNDVGGYMLLADWCEQRGLTMQAAKLYRKILMFDPARDYAYSRLVHITDTTRLPELKERRKKLASQFDSTFKLYAAPHFLVIYNTDMNWMLDRVTVLEKTHNVFYRTLRQGGYRPLPLADRLVCVLLNTPKEFHAYAHATNDNIPSWSRGYYSPNTNRIAYYRDRNAPQYQQIKASINELETCAAQLDQQLNDAVQQQNLGLVNELRKELHHINNNLSYLRSQISDAAKSGNAMTTVHETSHQLAYNSGFQKRGVCYPFWFAEGVATNFETSDPNQPFGPMCDNIVHQRILKDAMENHILVPLIDFVGLERPLRGHEKVRVCYAQAWGLFHFLFRYHRQEMRAYIETLRVGPVTHKSATQLRDEFTKAFGPLDLIEDQWVNYIRRMK